MLFLVVDDDALSRDLLTVLLQAEGYRVEVAVSGEAAVARLGVGAREGLPTPDVILTDMRMPGLAGGALARALKPLLKPGTPMLAMSGSRPRASALKEFDGFLLKPFEVGELKSMALSISEAGSLAGQPAPDCPTANGSFCEALDEEIYTKLSELMPAAQLGQMYALCVQDARKRIARMEALAAAGDDARYRCEAHAVKGGCGMIGACELYALAAAAEEDGIAPRAAIPGTATAPPVPAQLSLACDRLERILGERMRG